MEMLFVNTCYLRRLVHTRNITIEIVICHCLQTFWTLESIKGVKGIFKVDFAAI